MSKSTVVKMRSFGRIGVFVVALLLIMYGVEIGLADDLTSSKANSRYLKNYNFSRDFFSHSLPLFKKTFGHLEGKPGINYLEIGVDEGGSAIWMLENILTAPTARMTCIDSFGEEVCEKFLANLRMSGFYKKVTLIKGYSQVELRYLPLNSFDIIYIDGSHVAKDVLVDAALSWGLLKPGGIMFFDDYMITDTDGLPVESRPQFVIDSFIRAFNDDIEIIHSDYQLILKKL